MKIELNITEDQLDIMKEMLQRTIDDAQHMIDYWRKSYEQNIAPEVMHIAAATSLKNALSACPVAEESGNDGIPCVEEHKPATEEFFNELEQDIQDGGLGGVDQEETAAEAEPAHEEPVDEQPSKYPQKKKKAQQKSDKKKVSNREWIREHMNSMKAADMAKHLGISASAVYQQMDNIAHENDPKE